jgi:hypothetical protein
MMLYLKTLCEKPIDLNNMILLFYEVNNEPLISTMGLFRKKVTESEYHKFRKHIQSAVETVQKDNKNLKKQLTIISQVTMTLLPLSKKFTDIQSQFTDIVKDFTTLSMNQNKQKEEAEIQNSNVTKSTQKIYHNNSDHLTQLEQKGLLFIGKLQNEAGSQYIPVGSLTTNLYPDRNNRKIKTTVSNVLKKLQDQGFIQRERQGNNWYVGLTTNGFEEIKKTLDQNQLKNLIQIYR